MYFDASLHSPLTDYTLFQGSACPSTNFIGTNFLVEKAGHLKAMGNQMAHSLP